MNLDAVIDSILSPIADKISGIIFYSVTINGVKVELLVALLIFAAIYFTVEQDLSVSGGLNTQSN